MSRTVSSKAAHGPQRIIAIGGAKGGVGKSLLAANLGVYLAGQGYRTVVVDLDLGGANLHLYLGAWALKHRINDYLDKKFEHLADIAVPTEYGPLLIGGGSSRLGSANLPFVRKLKLMRAIRKLDADRVIIDLGGSTSFNTLDFFLLADTGLVMTSCDPAAYLDAYTFIKMALYRRLARIFGPEHTYAKHKDEALLSVIQDFISPDDSQAPQRITDLMDLIDAQAPQRKYLVEETIDRFNPRLVVNMADSEEHVTGVILRMQKVSQRMLSIDIECAGRIPTDDAIAQSAHDLKPELARHPKGRFARNIAEILENA